MNEKEKEYWKIVNEAEDYTRVYYGSDLDVKNQGSLFPQFDEESVK